MRWNTDVITNGEGSLDPFVLLRCSRRSSHAAAAAAGVNYGSAFAGWTSLDGKHFYLSCVAESSELVARCGRSMWTNKRQTLGPKDGQPNGRPGRQDVTCTVLY